MTPRQLLAISKPCARAEDVDEIERVFVDFKGFRWSTKFTVNR